MDTQDTAGLPLKKFILPGILCLIFGIAIGVITSELWAKQENRSTGEGGLISKITNNGTNGQTDSAQCDLQELADLKAIVSGGDKYLETYQYKLVDKCDDSECLFKGPQSTEGYGKLIGYYKRYRTSVPNNDTISMICDALVITGGSKPLIDNFRDLIDAGDTRNFLDSESNVNVTFSLLDIQETERSQVIDSTSDAPIELRVIRKDLSTVHSDSGLCQSYIHVLNVK